jgi:hypothetical protein
MVGWGFAFKKGVVLWLWCILWVIVGVVIFVAISIGSVLLLADVLLNPTSEALAPEAFARTLSQMIIGLLGDSLSAL